MYQSKIKFFFVKILQMAASSSKTNFNNLMNSSDSDDSEKQTQKPSLSKEQVERIENNRKRALEIRRTKESASKMYFSN